MTVCPQCGERSWRYGIVNGEMLNICNNGHREPTSALVPTAPTRTLPAWLPGAVLGGAALAIELGVRLL